MFLLLHRGDGKVGLAVVIYLKAGNVVPTEAGICCYLEVGGRVRFFSFSLCSVAFRKKFIICLPLLP